MTNILLILFFVLLFLLLFYSKRNRGLAQKTTISPTYVPFLKEQEFNPDISTDNWDYPLLPKDSKFYFLNLRRKLIPYIVIF